MKVVFIMLCLSLSGCLAGSSGFVQGFSNQYSGMSAYESQRLQIERERNLREQLDSIRRMR